MPARAVAGEVHGSLGRLHAKLAVVDRAGFYIGSMNMDRRSAHLNTEMGLIVDSPELAGQLASLLRGERQPRSYQVRSAGGSKNLQWVAQGGDAPVVLAQRTEFPLVHPAAPGAAVQPHRRGTSLILREGVPEGGEGKAPLRAAARRSTMAAPWLVPPVDSTSTATSPSARSAERGSRPPRPPPPSPSPTAAWSP